MKKGGKCILFPQLVKSMHNFSPIDLKYSKWQDKAANFSPAAHPLLILNFIWGININQYGGGLGFYFPTIFWPLWSVYTIHTWIQTIQCDNKKISRFPKNGKIIYAKHDVSMYFYWPWFRLKGGNMLDQK